MVLFSDTSIVISFTDVTKVVLANINSAATGDAFSAVFTSDGKTQSHVSDNAFFNESKILPYCST